MRRDTALSRRDGFARDDGVDAGDPLLANLLAVGFVEAGSSIVGPLALDRASRAKRGSLAIATFL